MRILLLIILLIISNNVWAKSYCEEVIEIDQNCSYEDILAYCNSVKFPKATVVRTTKPGGNVIALSEANFCVYRKKCGDAKERTIQFKGYVKDVETKEKIYINLQQKFDFDNPPANSYFENDSHIFLQNEFTKVRYNIIFSKFWKDLVLIQEIKMKSHYKWLDQWMEPKYQQRIHAVVQCKPLYGKKNVEDE